MLKSNSKRKRRRDEIEEVKDVEKMLKDNKQKFLKEYKRMKSNEGMSNEEMEYLYGAKSRIESLIKEGYLDTNGRPL